MEMERWRKFIFPKLVSTVHSMEGYKLFIKVTSCEMSSVVPYHKQRTFIYLKVFILWWWCWRQSPPIINVTTPVGDMSEKGMVWLENSSDSYFSVNTSEMREPKGDPIGTPTSAGRRYTSWLNWQRLKSERNRKGKGTYKLSVMLSLSLGVDPG